MIDRATAAAIVLRVVFIDGPSLRGRLIVRKLDFSFNGRQEAGAERPALRWGGPVAVGPTGARQQLIRSLNEQLLLDHIRGGPA